MRFNFALVKRINFGHDGNCMRLFLLRLFVLAILAVPVGAIAVYKGSDLSSATPATALRSEPGEQVLGVADSIANMIFKVSIPAKFEDSVTFAQPISAPNLIDSLQAGTGIKVDGNQITNTGLLSLVAGTGISVDGNKITNTGITSLSAGTGISIDGNRITNTLEATTPDYTLSGWDTGDGIVYLSDITDKVGIGVASPTSALHVVGSSNLAGNVIIGTASSDTVTILGSISAGSSIIPSNDLGADLGSSSKRFNNLWVANINSNSSQSFSGQTTFSYAPTDDTISQASILINPTSSASNGQLLGLGIAGYQRALIDEDGDLILGYNSATSAPATDYPLDIYGHSGTRVSFVDTSGNGYFAGSVGIGTTATGLFHVTSSTVDPNIIFHRAQQNYSHLTISNSVNTMVVGVNRNATSGLAVNAIANAGILSINEAQALQFGTNSVVRMSILSDGNVGIGTTSPNSKLHVAGDIEVDADKRLYGALQSTTTSSGYIELYNSSTASLSIVQRNVADSTSGLYLQAKGHLIFKTDGNNERMRIDRTTGNVGIGTTSPTSKLHVSGKVTGKALAIFDETGDQDILTASASGVTRLTIKNDGKVGIGNVAPSYLLDVTGTARVTGSLAVGTNGNLQYSSGRLELVSGSGGQIALYTDATERVRITGLGNFGIGTSAPTTKLHVSGKVTGKSLAIFDETGDQALLTASASGVTKFVIDHSGQVAIGLGSTATTNTLEVNGSFRAGAISPTNRYASVASTGLMTIRYDDNSVRNPLTLENRDSGAGDEGIGLLFNLARSGSATAINAGLLTVQKEQAWTSTASTQDSYLSFKTTKDGTMAEKLRISSGGLVNGTIGGLATFTKAGTISDTDFADAAVDGLLGFDSTNGRLYVRNAGAWSYIAKTAGFQIPDYESVGLEAGDFLVPYVEKKMEDGAVHGLYTKWSEVKNTLLADLWAKINEIEAKLLTMKDEIFTKKSHQEELCIGTTENETCVTKDQLDKLIELLPSPTSSSSASPTPTPTTSPTPIPSPSLEPSPTSSPSGVQ